MQNEKGVSVQYRAKERQSKADVNTGTGKVHSASQ